MSGTEPDIPIPPLPKIDGITLHFEIARGGMGIVYSGRQDFLDRRVAVKLLATEHGGAQFEQRFRREAKLLAGIKHPNIVACHSAGSTDEGQSYLVMEFVDGPTLKSWIDKNGPLSCAAALRLTRAIGQALAHAYLLDVIHRDVKAENILLETLSSTAIDMAFPFTPKLVDLGLARVTHQSADLGLTSPGSVMGTPSTMSPEQFDEPESVDFRSDIYGLGCAFYEMLTGQPAFRSKKLSELVTKKREPRGPNPCAENAWVPAAVGELVSCMLAANRDARPQSYQDLDRRLEALLLSLPKELPSGAPGSDQVATGATIASVGPRSSKSSSGPPSTRPPEPTARRSKPSASSQKTGPGLLQTSEINFLAEGLAAAQPEVPAFRDGSELEATPSGTTTKGARRSRMPIVAAAAVLVLGGTVAFFATRGDGKEPVVPPGPDPGPANRPPQGIAITFDGEKPDRVDLGKKVTLVATAEDPDKDVLTYTWEGPDEVTVKPSGPSGSKATVTIRDGLPDVVFPISLSVGDGKNPPVLATQELAVGECRATDPLSDFSTRDSRWKGERGTRAWIVVTETGAASGKAASGQVRTLQTSLGGETYWEWFGHLESEGFNSPTYADTEVRLELGDRGCSILLTRTGDFGRHWSIDIQEATRAGEAWQRKPLTQPQRLEWDEDEKSEDESFASFSLQRRGQRLVLQIGQAVKRVSAATIEPVPGNQPQFETTIGDFTGEPTLTLSVKNGTGRFRLRVR